MASVQAAVYGSHEPVLTPDIFKSVLAHKMYEHQQRAVFKLGHHGVGDAKAPQQAVPAVPVEAAASPEK